MKTIHLHNYESYLIDKLDGTLDAETLQELDAFLMAHPHLQEEAEFLDSVVLTAPTNEQFDSKLSLKIPDTQQGIHAGNYEHFLIAQLENDLSAKQVDELSEFLKLHVPAQQTQSEYQRTKLPLEDLVFEHKQSLYKQNKVIALRWIPYAAAAVLLLALFVTQLDTNTQTRVALNQEPPTSVTTEVKKDASETNTVVMIPNEPTALPERKQVAERGVNKMHRNIHMQVIDNKHLACISVEPLAATEPQKLELEFPLTAMLTEEPQVEQKPYLSLAELGIKNIKSIANEATIQSGVQNASKLHWTDFAAFLLAKFNKRTGSHYMLEKTTDAYGNTMAYGITGKEFELEKK